MTWNVPTTATRWRQRNYSDAAMQKCLSVRLMSALALRRKPKLMESMLWLEPDGTRFEHALVWRVSTQNTGNLARIMPSNSHCNSGQALSALRSIPNLVSVDAFDSSSEWQTTFVVRHIRPFSSTMQIAVSFTEAFNPTKCVMTRASSYTLVAA